MRPIVSAAAALLALHVAATAALGQTTTDSRPQALVSQLQSAIDAAGWDQDRWSVLVVSLAAGDTLFAHRAEASVLPASNLKLFTTAAALYTLGPDHRYSTYLTGTGPVRAGVLEGDLYVYGTGDPTISDRFFDSKTTVWEALADSLAAAGVQRIAGDVVGDASYFEGPGFGQGWQQAYVTHTYAAVASALSFNDNVVTLRVTPGDRAGAPARIQFVPGGEVAVRNEAATTTSGRSWIEVERAGYDAPTVLRGDVRQGGTAHWRAFPVSDPARFAVSVLVQVLRERGIQVDGGIRTVEAAEASPITGQTVFAPVSEEDPVIQVLAIHRSPPLQEILTVINQRSHNLYADAVLRTVGRVATGSGSARGGEAAVLALLEEAGAAGAAVRMDDGSGLSLLNRASARSIVELLAFMADSPFASAYMATLPEAANDRGLRRMQQTAAAGNLRAKTGTIDRVSALSGYVRAENGEMLAFAILANDVPSTWTAKRVEDRIGARLASFSRPARTGTGPAVAASTPSPDTVADTTEPERTSEYVIQSGDTLEGIARKRSTSVAAIREANPGVDARRLIPGRSLTIPDSGGSR